MGVLIACQWRLLHRSLAVWTALALLNAVVQALPGFVTTMPGPRLFPVALFALAAALGAGVRGGAGAATWMRSLPVSNGRVFTMRCMVGFTLVLAGIAFVAVVWHAGLPLVAEFRQSRIRVPGADEWLSGALLCLGPFSASAFFASSFERLGASRQAGVAGFFASLVWIAWFDSLELGPALFALASASGLVAAWRLSTWRGIDEGTPSARLLRRIPPRDLALVLPAQIAFVVVPLWSILAAQLAGPGLLIERSTVEMTAIGSLAIGLALLPWGWKDARVRGVHGWKRIAALGLVATGAGVWIWRLLRPRGEVVRCTSCRTERLDTSVRCQRCGREPLQLVALGRFNRLLPFKPGGIVLWSFSFLLFGGCLFGGQRYLHVWEIHADLPGVEIRLGDETRTDGPVRGWGVGQRLGPRIGLEWGGPSSSLQRARELPVTIAELAAAEERFVVDEAVFPPIREYLPDRLGAHTLLDVSFRGFPCTLSRATLSITARNFVVATDVRLYVECAELDAFVDELLLASVASALRDDLIAEAVAWGDAFFVRLLTRRDDRPEARARARQLFDSVLDARRDLARASADELFERIDRRLEPDRLMPGRRSFAREQFPYVAAELMALARLGDAIGDELEDRIVRGDACSMIAAGLGKVARCWDACSSRLVEESPWRKMYAIWALLAIDPARAAPLLEDAWRRLDDYGRYELTRLIGFTGSAELLRWLESVTDPDEAGRNGLAHARELQRMGYTLEDYLF